MFNSVKSGCTDFTSFFDDETLKLIMKPENHMSNEGYSKLYDYAIYMPFNLPIDIIKYNINLLANKTNITDFVDDITFIRKHIFNSNAIKNLLYFYYNYDTILNFFQRYDISFNGKYSDFVSIFQYIKNFLLIEHNTYQQLLALLEKEPERQFELTKELELQTERYEKIQKEPIVIFFNKETTRFANLYQNILMFENNAHFTKDSEIGKYKKSLITDDYSSYTDDELFHIFKLIYEQNKKNVLKIIKDLMVNNNYLLLDIMISKYNNNKDAEKEPHAYHANTILIIKTEDSKYLAVRCEPHRRAYFYCRNSVRKELRELVKKAIPGIHYIDYLIDGHTGIQEQEYNKISTQNAAEQSKQTFEGIYQERLSPLTNEGGNCYVWSFYASLFILLNVNKPINYWKGYFLNYNFWDFQKILNENTNFTNQYIKQHKLNKMSYGNVINYFQKKNKYTGKQLLNFHLNNYIMLYYLIINSIGFNFLKNNTDLSKKDYNIFKKICSNKKFMNSISSISQELEDNIKTKYVLMDEIPKDTHYCDDTLFSHKLFCRNKEYTTSVPKILQRKCGKTRKLKVDPGYSRYGTVPYALTTIINQRRYNMPNNLSSNTDNVSSNTDNVNMAVNNFFVNATRKVKKPPNNNNPDSKKQNNSAFSNNRYENNLSSNNNEWTLVEK